MSALTSPQVGKKKIDPKSDQAGAGGRCAFLTFIPLAFLGGHGYMNGINSSTVCV